MDEATVVIGLELHGGCDALAGRIVRPDGVVTEFSGWVGLIAALDELVRAGHETGRGGDESPPEGGIR